jgi:hypothetical protein
MGILYGGLQVVVGLSLKSTSIPCTTLISLELVTLVEHPLELVTVSDGE